ncbi:Rho GTPase-activating protein 39 [Schistosoma japonicum]|nr:Rho GTPase-activating protein 39 [Schistosoma japonicum]
MDSSNITTHDWVQLIDPKTQKLLYVNLKSGECSRDPPNNVKYKTVSPNQWWELFDIKAQRNYYYNSSSRETVWQKPVDGDIIPLAKIQLLQQHLQPSLTFQKDVRFNCTVHFYLYCSLNNLLIYVFLCE